MSVILSDRLKALADMVSPGRRVVDVGCDHGFLSIYLVQKEISPKVLAMDVRTGPLERAKEHISAYELGTYIETRLSDGLLSFENGEAQTMVCAGMGGRVMAKILRQSREKARHMEELILQPQSEIPAFRRFLREEGYTISDENILCEEGKYYFLIKAAYRPDAKPVETAFEEEHHLYDQFGEKLLKSKHPVLKEYLDYRMHTAKQIEASLGGSAKERAGKRLLEVRQEQEMLRKALSYFQE